MDRIRTGAWGLLLGIMMVALGGCGEKGASAVLGSGAAITRASQVSSQPARGSSLIPATENLPPVCDGYIGSTYFAPSPPKCTKQKSAKGFLFTCENGTARSRAEDPAFTVPVTFNIATRAQQGKNRVVVFYLHGLAGTGDLFHQQVTAAIASQLEGEDAPLAVVGIDLGPYFFFTLPDPEARNSGLACLLPTILNQVDEVLSHVLPGANGAPYERTLLGISMGGGNAIVAAESFPDYFSRVLLACPAIPGVSPLSTTAELKAAAKKEWYGSLGQLLVDKMLAKMYMGSTNMGDLMPEPLADHWPKELPLFLLYNESDEHLFGIGAQLFLDRLNQDGAKSVIGHAFPGGHCAFQASDLTSPSEFLLTGK